jgi:hypothetical protein
MRWRFWSWAVPLVVEAPSFFVARACARTVLQTDELTWEDVKIAVRDVRLKYVGTDMNRDVKRLLILRRVEGAWDAEWKEAQL